MDFLSNYAVLVVPRWVKAAVTIIISTLSILYIGSGILGVIDPDRSGWVQAGAEILGVLVPILLAVLVIGYSQTGVKALTEKSFKYLTVTIPESTALLRNIEGDFKDFSNRSTKFGKIEPPNLIIQSSKNVGIANYFVSIEGNIRDKSTVRKIAFRLELNPTKINVNVLVPAEKLPVPTDASTLTETLSQLFIHTIAGAEREGYWFHKESIQRVINGRHYVAIVARKKLDHDFLLSPIKQLDLAQDLMLMLHSCLFEQPSLFES